VRSRVVAAAGAAALVVVAGVVAVVLVGRDRDGAVVEHAADPGTHVVGYYTAWGGDRRDYRVKDVRADRLTHLVYAFGSVAGGRCAAGDPEADERKPVGAADSVDGIADADADPVRGNINQLRKLKRLHPTLKVLWSFGGWDGSAGFTAAARDPAAFAASCRALVEDPRWGGVFDGIDVDWEYPNACGRGCDTSGRDALAALTGALRTAFGPDALVTAAFIGDGSDGGPGDAADYRAAAAPLDWVMAMTYDYFGPADPSGPTAPHSALTSYPGLPREGATAQAGIAKLTGLGIPAAKLLLGVGFYGRGWTGVTSGAPGGRATGTGVADYRVLAAACPATGTIGGTGYALCGDKWWSYDTPDTIAAKMAYVRQQHLGGAFAWQLAGDTADGRLLGAMAGALTGP
jgi:chitinase